jgi:hypothetical protein
MFPNGIDNYGGVEIADDHDELEIIYDYKNNYEIILLMKEEDGTEGPLFMQLCNFLSIDFYNLGVNLSEYMSPFKKFPRKKMIESLKTLSFLLVTESSIQKLSSFFKYINNSAGTSLDEAVHFLVHNLFSEFIYIQTYVEVMQDKKIFENKEVFRSFISGFVFQGLIEYENLYDSEKKVHGHYASVCKQDNINDVLHFADNLGKYDSNMSNFHLSDSLSAVCTSLYYLLDRGYTIKKCSNCGKYFVPFNRSDTIYCDRPSPQDSNRTCKEYGAEKLWYDKLKQNEVASLCRKISQAKQKKASRYKDLPIYLEQYERFQKESKQWKSDIKKGLKTEAEFLEWLNLERKK